MRVELHLFLWVTAAVAIGTVLFRGPGDVPQIPSVQSGTELEGSLLASEEAQSAATVTLQFPRSLPDIDKRVRPLFTAVGTTPSVEAPVAEVVAALPILKGIISGADGLHAVFVLDPATSYVVVGPGESIGAYQIKDVAMDRVLGVSAGGEEVTFNLRGAGEHP